MNLTLSKKSAQKVPVPPPFTPTLPSVNLLPLEVQQVLGLRSLRRKFVAAGIALVALLVLAYGAQFAVIASATNDLEQAKAQTQTLNSQMRKLAPVKAFYAAVESNQKTIQTTMANEILYSSVVAHLNATRPDGVTIGNVSVSATPAVKGAPGAAPAASSCPGPDPFNPTASTGCINISGTAKSRQVVGRLIENLFSDPMFANPYVSSTTADESGTVTFTATVAMTDKVYSKRYADVNFLKEATK